MITTTDRVGLLNQAFTTSPLLGGQLARVSKQRGRLAADIPNRLDTRITRIPSAGARGIHLDGGGGRPGGTAQIGSDEGEHALRLGTYVLVLDGKILRLSEYVTCIV